MAPPPTGSGPGGPPLLLGTHAGMSLEDVLFAVPGSVVYQEPLPGEADAPVVLAGHEDIEVAGLVGSARFAFAKGGLASVTLALDHRAPQEGLLFLLRQLVVLLVETLGRPSRLEESPGSDGDDVRTFSAAWSKGGAVIDLDVTVRGERATGELTARALPNP